MPTHSVKSQLRRARGELEASLRASGDARAEAYLSEYPAVAADHEAALELVYTEFLAREELGQTPDPADWYRRFPHWRTDLEQMFEVHRELRREDSQRKSRSQSTAEYRPLPPSRTAARTVGEFEVIAEVGRGGMGVVYKARQPSLGRVVAVKVLLSGAHAGGRERERFRLEAETAARLDHPNIVRIFEVGEHDGRAFCAMEFVDGSPLADLLTAGPWPARRAAELMATVAAAVQHAHQNGVIHRDLKPANILIAGNRRAGAAAPTEPAASHTPRSSAVPDAGVKIVDFGLAKSLLDTDRGPTRTGDIIGTPAYMAPEQADAASGLIGPPTDVWGMGVTLYELLVGRPPFLGDSTVETLHQVRQVEPVPPHHLRPALPRDLEVICLKCLRKRPADRYPTAAAVADDLNRWLRGEPIHARPVNAVEHVTRWCRRNPVVAGLVTGLVVVLVAGVAGVVVQWLRADHERDQAVRSGQQEALARQEADRVSRLEAAARGQADARLYASRIAQVTLDLSAGRTLAAERILDECRAADPGRCGWEWDYLRRKCHTHVVEMAGHTQPVNSLTYSPDGRWIASGGGRWNGTDPGEVKLWDATTGKLVRDLTGAKATVHRVAFHPRGDWLAAADMGGFVHRWNLKRPEQTFPPIACGSGVFWVAVHPDGGTLAVALSNGGVWLIDAATGKVRHKHPGDGQNVYDVAFSPDGKCVASACRDGRVTVRSTDTFEVLHQLLHPSGVRRVLFTPDGQHLVSAAYDGEVKVWDRAGGYRLAATFNVGPDNLSQLLCRPDSAHLACCTRTSGLKIWAIRGQREEATPIRAGATWGAAYCPDSRWLAAAHDDNVIRVWDTAPPPDPRVFQAHASWIVALAVSPDGQTLAAAAGRNWNRGGGAKSVRLLDSSTGTLRAELGGHADWLTAVAYRADGRQLMTADEGGVVNLWDLRTRQVERTLPGHRGAVHAAAYHPTEPLAATAGEDGTARLWDVATGTEVRALTHPRGVLSLAFSTDGRRLATGCADGRVRVWDVTTGDLAHELAGHQAAVNALAFRPGSSVLTSADEDQEIRFWDAEQGSHLSAHPYDRFGGKPRAGETDPAPKSAAALRESHLAFSPDGRRLAFGSTRGATQVWDADSRQLLLTLDDTESRANHHVAFTPDGERLLTDHTSLVRVWDSRRRASEDGTVGDARRLGAVYRQRATAAEEMRDWFTAEYYADRVVQSEPDDAEWLARRGMARRITGRATEAEADHHKAVESIGRRSADDRAKIAVVEQVVNACGEGFAYRKEWAEAERTYRKATRDHPDSPLGWANLAGCLLAQNKAEEHRECCRQMLGRFATITRPADVTVLANAVVAAPPGANREELLRLTKLPADAINDRALGAVLLRVGRYREALARFRAAQAGGANPRGRDMLFRALALHHLRDPAEAREWLANARTWIAEADRVASTPTANGLTWSEWNEEVETRAILVEAEALIADTNNK